MIPIIPLLEMRNLHEKVHLENVGIPTTRERLQFIAINRVNIPSEIRRKNPYDADGSQRETRFLEKLWKAHLYRLRERIVGMPKAGKYYTADELFSWNLIGCYRNMSLNEKLSFLETYTDCIERWQKCPDNLFTNLK